MEQQTSNEVARSYNEVYQQDDYFGYRHWLYLPYVRALISFLGLRKGTTVLDAGCGQGLFTHLFAKEGMSVVGVDVSEVGIARAVHNYPELEGRLVVADLNRPAGLPTVACVFLRCCSVYDVPGMAGTASTTRGLLDLLQPGGVLIFATSSNLTRTGKTWMSHDFADVRKHFDALGIAYELYFINKIDTYLLGRFAFNRVFTAMNRLVCKLTGLSGDIIVIARPS